MPLRQSELHVWREEIGRRLLKLDFEPASDAPFRATIDPLADTLPAVVMRMPPGRTFRDHELVKDGADTIGLVMPLGCDVAATHQGRELHLAAGEAVVLEAAKPGQVGSRQGYTVLSVVVPRTDVLASLGGRQPRVATTIPRHCPSLRLLRTYVGCIGKSGPLDGTTDAAARRHIVDLVALAAAGLDSGPTERAEDSRQAARLRYVLQQIDSRCQEPDLSIPALALEQGVSVRFLQRLLETSGASFSKRLAEARLAKAHALLTKAGGEPCRISAVAFACGYGDLSTFNRQFLRKFGTPPSRVRCIR